MKIVVFGATGQVATELQRRVPEGVEVTCIGRDRADFSDPASVARIAQDTPGDVFVNAVAYTAVDRAEAEPELADLVNHLSVRSLAEALSDTNRPLVHISTDYVFDGSGEQPWTPDAAKGPLNTYGRSKLLGEEAIRASGIPHVILRTSWVFSAHGSNFVKSMLRLGQERETLSIVSDQIGGPTPATAIADTIFATSHALGNGEPGGTHHYAGTPDTSWAGFAREIFQQAHISCDVIDIPTTDYPTPAIRPLNSRLDCESLERNFGIKRPDWRRELAIVLKELI